MSNGRIIHELQAGRKFAINGSPGRFLRLADVLKDETIQAFVEMDDVMRFYWASDKLDWGSEPTDFGTQRPPFNVMWFEGKAIPANQAKTSDGSKQPEALTDTAYLMFTEGTNVTVLQFYMLSGVGIVVNPYQIGYQVSDDGQTTSNAQIFGDKAFLAELVAHETARAEDGKFTIIMPHEAMLAIGLMHCRNVGRIESGEQAPKALRKKIAAKGSEPVRLTRIVLPGMAGATRQNMRERVGADLPLHMVRGHFKTFTPDAPLFGSRVGTYWWGWQARGKRENGAVEHIYEVGAA